MIRPGKSYASVVSARDEDNTVELKFLNFLKNFTLAPGESPYYKGELKAMVERKSLIFCVYYGHVAEFDEELGNSLCRSCTRLQPMLNNALKLFIIEQKLKDECMKISTSPRPKVVIHGLPPPGSIQALKDFLGEENNKVVKKVQIHGNESIISDTTELGRNLFIGLLEYIFSEHRNGLSWNGTFSMNDLQVKDRIRFEIAIKASEQATSQAMAKDMKQLVYLLSKSYIPKGCPPPAYFDDLFNSMRDCLLKIRSYNSVETISFRRYLLSHLALKSAMARGHLFLDLYRVRQAIGRDNHRDLTHLLTSIPCTDWSSSVSKHPMLEKVYKFGIKEADGTPKKRTPKKKPYNNDLDHLLIFIRHAVQHGPDNTKDNDHEQTLKSLIENDLIISNHLQFHILKLIKTLLDKYKMKDDIFSDVWSHFSESK